MQSALVISIVLAGGAVVRADDPPPVNFDEHIVPIFNEYCFDCHRGGKAKNGLRLDALISVLEGGSGGPAVVPGDASSSLLYQVVAHAREPFMPYKDDKLEDDVVAMIRAWIDAGAPENPSSRPVVVRPTVAPVTIEPGASNEPAGAPAMPTNVRREPYWWSEGASAIMALAASPWAPLVAVAGHGQVALYHAESSEMLGVLEFPGGTINTLTFSRNGALLLAGGGRGAVAGRVLVWDVANGERVLDIGDEPDVVLSADISNDHQRVVLGGPDGVVRVYTTATGALLYELTKHTDWVTAVAFSPDGVLLATGDRSGGVWVWESDTSREFHALPPHAGRVTSLDWRLDSNVLATSGEDGAIRLFEMEGGSRVKAWSSHGGVLGLTFLRDARLASCGRDTQTRLWDGNGAEQRRFGPAADITTSVAVTHDGSRVLVGDWTGVVQVYATADGQALGTLRANPVTSTQREIAASENALGPLREQVTMRETETSEANAERARRAEAASAARTALTAAGQAAETLEAEASVLEAARVAAQPNPDLVAAIETARAELGRAQRDLTTADVDASRTEAEMLAAQLAVVEAATALADAGDAERAAAAERKGVAETLLRGATAVAQLAAETAARLRVERERCAAGLTGRETVLAPRQAQARDAAAAATAARDRANEARGAAMTQAERSREIDAEVGAAEDAARVADTALTEARAALEQGEERLRVVNERWEQQRVAIAAAGGRVE